MSWHFKGLISDSIPNEYSIYNKTNRMLYIFSSILALLNQLPCSATLNLWYRRSRLRQNAHYIYVLQGDINFIYPVLNTINSLGAQFSRETHVKPHVPCVWLTYEFVYKPNN